MSINWDRFVEVIKAHNKFVLTSHIRPDCDALGSELGMAGVLKALGKEVRIVNGQTTPPNLQFIDPESQILAIGETVQEAELADAEILMILDTSAWAQLGPMGDVIKNTKADVIVLDHHVSEDDLGAELFKDTTAEAAGRLVVDAAEALGVTLTPEISKPLFAAIATDTGWFRFPSADEETYQYGAKLIAAGAKPADIYSELYEQDSLGRIKLRGTVLARTAIELEGKLAHTFILKEDYTQTGAHPSDTEDLVNLTLGIRGTEGAVIFVEQPKGGFKLSFRSRGPMDCSQVASNFGGGGHRAAAGAFIEGELDAIREKVLPIVTAAMS